MAGTTGITAGALDVRGLVSQLMKVERQPIDKLNAKNTAYQAKISALGLIKSNIAGFQTAAKALSNAAGNTLNVFKATSSDTTTLTASASSTATPGTYSIVVDYLAQAQSLVAAGQATKNTAISDGTATTLSFDFGTIDISASNSFGGGSLANGVYTDADFTSNGSGTKTVTIDGSNNTLEGIRDAVNAANIGVTASIINDGSATPYRLAFSVTETGANQSLKISAAGGDGTIGNLLAYDPTGTQKLSQTVAAQNAKFSVNNVSISQSSNTVSTAIDGVTINLLKTNATATTLTIARDQNTISEKATAFVKAYNDLYSALKNASTYKSKSALEGDATLRSFMTQLREIASDEVTGGSLNHLIDVGITFNSSGTMQLDSGKLTNAVSSKFSDVSNLFSSTNGIFSQFDNWADTQLSAGGTLDSKTTGINRAIETVNKQISSLEVRMSNIEKQYLKTYTNLNTMLESMSKTSAYLAQQLG